MPTYDQLNAEAVWRNETVTAEMDWLGAQLCAALGVPRANFGVKGDNASGHMRGGHRSQAWILGSKYCTSRTYTVEPGLPAANLNDVPAFDITPKTREQMLAISRNLDRVTRAGQLEEIVVWYGNTDNDQRVDGWDNIRNAVASSDDSHLWHLHGQLGRRHTRSRNVMERVLAALLGRPLPGGDDVQADERAWLQNIYNAQFFGGPSMGTPAPGKVNSGSSGNAVINLLQHTRREVDALRAVAAQLAADVAEIKARPPATIALDAEAAAALGPTVEAAVRKVLGGLDGATPQG